MKTTAILATTFALSALAAGSALAGSHHGHGGNAPQGGIGGPMSGGGHDRMKMMHRMHSGRMGGMGAGASGMMDHDMMRMMMRDAMMSGPANASGFGRLSAEKFAAFDADASGTLSIAEFEALHAALIREIMVDRFQHLDADGDGLITSDEMAVPAARIERRMMQGAGDGDMDKDE